MKKLLALILSLMMILSMSISVFAENSDGESYTRGSITIKNPQEGETYKAYKIFDVTYNLGGDGTTDDKYAYTINPEWVDDVIAYTGATADANGVYTGKGMIITPVKDTAGTITCYNVTLVEDDPATTTVNEATFSAADFGEKMAAKTSTKSSSAKTLTVDATTGKTMVKELDLGYYMVQPTTANSLVSLTTTDKDVEISDKNEKPVPDKKLVGESPILICTTEIHEHTAACYTDDVLTCTKEEHKAHTDACYKEKDYTTKSVGDKVEFEVDTKVPDMTGYKTYFFVLNDTMSKGLSFNDDVKVFIDGAEIPATAYTVKTTGGGADATEIRVVFNNMLQWQSKAGKPIVVTYSAILGEDAVMGTAGNTNEAKLEYSNDPNFEPKYNPDDEPEGPNDDPNDPQDPKYEHNKPGYTGDEPTGESNPDIVTVYTTELDITKIDGAAPTTTLTGAKFKIEGEKLNVSIVNKTIFKEDNTNGTWYRLKDGTYTQEVPDGNAETTARTGDVYVEFKEAKISYKELNGYQAVANESLYYSTDGGTTKTLITASNKASVPGDAKIYQPTYKNVGLYYSTGTDTYEAVTESTAAEHLTDTLYTKTIYKQSDKYEDTTKKYVKTTEITKENNTESYTAEGYVDSTGKITFTGLAEGTYYLTELVAPDGYNLLKAPVQVVVTLVPGSAANTYKFQAVIDGKTTSPVEETAGVLPFDIANNQGIELPETGGMGTVLFIAIGAVLFMAAGIVLTAKKRLYNEG